MTTDATAFGPATGRTILDGGLDRPAGWREPPPNPDLTCGQWATEADSVTELDRRLVRSGMFRIRCEVEGRPYAPTPTDEVKGYRIDRVLAPNEHAKAAGWNLGPVGIECKRSGVKIGKPVAQALDYRRALWHTEITPELWFSLGFVFVWPATFQYGPLSSVMAQNRVGVAVPIDDHGIVFSVGGHGVARIDNDGALTVKDSADSIGRKVGSR